MSTNVKLVIGFGIIIIVLLFWLFRINEKLSSIESMYAVLSDSLGLMSDTLKDMLEMQRLETEKDGSLIEALKGMLENQEAIRDILENNITPENKAKSPE